MKTNLIYATSNPGKIIEISRHFGFHSLNVHKLSDFIDAKLDPEEDGASLGDNALIKARAYAEGIARAEHLRGQRFIVIADDTGVFIDGLGGEPGIRVRRWKGYKMTDEEIIAHTIERMAGIPEGKRTATFKTILCVMLIDENGRIGEPVSAEGELKGRIIVTADPRRIEGFPFESLFFATEYGMILGDLHRLSDAEKRAGRFNHRERAIERAIPIIRRMMQN